VTELTAKKSQLRPSLHFFLPHVMLSILQLLKSKNNVAEPDSGSSALLIPGSGIRDGKNLDPGSVIRDKQLGSYFPDLGNNFGLKML
jgi:hypothetical protein